MRERIRDGGQLTAPKRQWANKQESNLIAIPAAEILPRRATKAVPVRTAAARAFEAHDFHGERSQVWRRCAL